LLSEKRAYLKHHQKQTPNVQEEGNIKQHYLVRDNSNSIINLKIDKREPQRSQSMDYSANKQ
jgi:hypothetical protein